jgi:hypothetical protein
MGRKFVIWLLRSWFFCLLFVLGACSSGTCVNTDIPGIYKLTAKKIIYLLQLNSDGTGFLNVAGENMGEFKWELDDLNDDYQAVALQIPNKIEDIMSELVDFNQSKSSSNKSSPRTEHSIFLLTAECNKNGHLKRLVADEDTGIWFVRSE